MIINNYLAAVILFLIGGLTDVLDGYIARKYNLITSFGKLADPLADKLMQITALVLLVIQQKLPLFVLMIVAVKELLMGIGSLSLLRKDKVVVSANWYGKLATVVFYFAILMLIFDFSYGWILILIAVIATLYAFFMYAKSYVNIKANFKTDNNNK
jgi:cardiolipin synthase